MKTLLKQAFVEKMQDENKMAAILLGTWKCKNFYVGLLKLFRNK
jgi:hypothetical protein